MVELTSNIKWPGRTFRAWKQGQYGYSTLVTMVLPPGAWDVFKQEDVVPLVLKQNGLEGSHSVPRFRTKDKGVTLVTMGIAPSLVNAIRALGGQGRSWIPNRTGARICRALLLPSIGILSTIFDLQKSPSSLMNSTTITSKDLFLATFFCKFIKSRFSFRRKGSQIV